MVGHQRGRRRRPDLRGLMSPPLSLFTRPTPVEPAPRLAEAIGLDAGRLWIKRDDLIGLGGGGNKVRKLEITMAGAIAVGADTVVTTGAPQSNHARLTAAAAARCGLRSVLVLEGEAPDRLEGNLLLDRLFDAEIVFSGDRDAADVAAQEARARDAYLIPFGGTDARSAVAYRDAGLELLGQLPDVGTVVVAVGSGGTMAGLVTALGTHRVLGVATGAVPDAHATVAGFVTDMGSSPEGLRIDDARIGDGYRHLTPETRDALELAARTEGLVLDPTYTGRAMAGLRAAAATSGLAPGPVVLLHTGGLPGLFGHAEFPDGV
ncbi:pyridoxal-phosphate dependent enzyme [Actinomycetospora atypica]|uniref:Pyridoxal-phosphate dependent enzyme n=1 Tax=Actinomycetospora atypica TaxID=1290095 RepID=A0ABV9YKL3_9PSEU